MDGKCHKCGCALSFQGSTIGFREECPKCRADVHCCQNCKFYDKGAYNECREPQSERVVDKERGNLCEYFKLGAICGGNDGSKIKDGTLKKLDDLFK